MLKSAAEVTGGRGVPRGRRFMEQIPLHEKRVKAHSTNVDGLLQASPFFGFPPVGLSTNSQPFVRGALSKKVLRQLFQISLMGG